MNHAELRARALRKRAVRVAYEEFAPEYALLKQLLAARKRAGLTQADVALKIGTHAPAITRLERSLVTGRHSPSLATIGKYAGALGCRLDIRLVHT